nr:uncharacterized protein LOC117274817 isoform X2 [Nicotiana tomentosiformis]
MVANASWLPEAWNYAPETSPPPLVRDIHDWVSQVLPHTLGIREWTTFIKKFGPAPSVTTRGSSRRSKAPTLAFRKRKATSIPSVALRSARSLTTPAARILTSPLRHLVDEDDEEELSPNNDNLLPRKR